MGLLDISISGLLSNQASISTTSHNIANASVEGYSRQRADQSSRLPEFIGGNYRGTGSEIGTIRRVFELTQQLEVQSATADFKNFDAFYTQAARVDSLLADSDTGINNALQQFFTALQGVANDPASIPARQVMLSEAGNLTARFELVNTQLESQKNEINVKIDSLASEITTIAENIAKLNNQIAGSPGSFPPDLLDKRDQQITRLSELVAVQTLQQSDGSINVFIGTGQSLVVGSLANGLNSVIDPLDPRGRVLTVSSGNSSIDITNNITGGELGGIIDAFEQLIEPALNTLGRVAMGLSETFNQQHQLGMDLNNQLGGNFFTDINDPALSAARVVPSTTNAGTAALSINIDDVAQLSDSQYELRLTAGIYTLRDVTNDTTVATFAPPAVVPDTVTVASEGFTINFNSGAALDGDVFEIQNTRDFSRDINVLLTAPEQIAAASPVRGEQSLANIGSGSITGISVTDTTTAQFTTTPGSLTPPVRIEFEPGGTFSILDITVPGAPVVLAAGIAGYVPNQDNSMLALAGAPFDTYGYEITLNGDPQAGDQFDFTYNNGGAGNNDNISILGDLQFAATLDQGNSTYQQAFGRAISQVGSRTNAAEINRDAASSLLFQATERKQSTSGVNLDEEAANLIKFQQAYEANAQVVSVARTLFQTVLDSVR